ncbi:D-alanine--D-alanine ligase [uncultured Tenacibaculum sp.]|uniref:D-alanine--D-alanine ligase n=1 Tax=uncultured Tenacibaculum sp. TaxID=174713 RepID=UPI00261C490A|nr:D-alanine--D-alanine ligase [uncultured Tenacibaculum sp.]
MNIKNKFYKIFNWEYWPSSMLYIPNLPYAFYLAYKAKHLAFFTAANPSIKSSGNGTESKFATMNLIPKHFRPNSILILPKTKIELVIQEIENANISYPLIAKPDVGFRGLLVKKINSPQELQLYLKKYPINIIIQEYIDYKNECGIFYHRNPNEATGKITSITLKKFLSVTGNGYSTLKDLVIKDNRAQLYIDIINETHPLKLNTIPKKNEIIKLSVIGNHCKGTQFINGNHLISKELHKTFDEINKSINGWYYGRLDIKYNTFDELQKGINLKILEINGILAEPTHIYDSKNYNYLKALKEIRLHWNNLYQIATTNHTQFNVPYKSSKLFINEMLNLKNYVTNIKNLN